jgi:hypothetical protein
VKKIDPRPELAKLGVYNILPLYQYVTTNSYSNYRILSDYKLIRSILKKGIYKKMTIEDEKTYDEISAIDIDLDKDDIYEIEITGPRHSVIDEVENKLAMFPLPFETTASSGGTRRSTRRSKKNGRRARRATRKRAPLS